MVPLGSYMVPLGTFRVTLGNYMDPFILYPSPPPFEKSHIGLQYAVSFSIQEKSVACMLHCCIKYN